MAYTNKVTEIVVGIIVVLFQAVAIESLPEINTPCALAIPEIVIHCYASTNMSSSPSEQCCNDLKTANKREVTCLCDNFIANPSKSNFPRTLYDQINTACGVADKFACPGGDTGRATNKIVASTSLFGLVTILVLLIH